MKNRKWIVAVIALVAVAGLLLGVWFATRPVPEDGCKSFTVTVVHGNGESRIFSLQSEEAYLGPVLLQEKIVEGDMDQFGLFIKSADGEEAVWEPGASSGAYWSIFEGDIPAVTGADQIVLKDGAAYKLVYTVG